MVPNSPATPDQNHAVAPGAAWPETTTAMVTGTIATDCEISRTASSAVRRDWSPPRKSARPQTTAAPSESAIAVSRAYRGRRPA
jgi:hypothetical protein